MPLKISEKKPVMFKVSKPSRHKQPTSQQVQSSPVGGIKIENHEMLKKQLLGQGDFKGESHTLNDPRNAVDRGIKINNWSLAFNGIQHRPAKFGKEYKKNDVPKETTYASHFTL